MSRMSSFLSTTLSSRKNSLENIFSGNSVSVPEEASIEANSTLSGAIEEVEDVYSVESSVEQKIEEEDVHHDWNDQIVGEVDIAESASTEKVKNDIEDNRLEEKDGT